MNFNFLLLFITLLSTLFSLQLNQIKEIIILARQNIWKQIDNNSHFWNFPSYVSSMFISQYHFQVQALNVSHISKFDPLFFKNKLIKSQLHDGSWKQVIDLNSQQGSLDATIFNYWFLKDIGLQQENFVLTKAKAFILSHGGLEASQLITKYKLAIFGQYSWDQLYNIPLYLFKNYWPFRWLYIKNYFSKQTYPLLPGLAYLKYHRYIFPVSKVCLNQLRINQNNTFCRNNTINKQQIFIKQQPQSNVINLIHEIIIQRGKRGSFGGYAISTMLSLLSLQHYYKQYKIKYNLAKQTQQNLQTYNKIQSINFVQSLYFENNAASYQGSINDGKYLDTILCSLALLQSQQDPKKLYSTMEYLKQHSQQGISQGQDLQHAPNIIYSSMLLSLYSNFDKKYQLQINKIIKWIVSRQNQDGGFPLYDIDKNDNQHPFISLGLFLTAIDNSLQFFDSSSADIAGHVLQSFGKYSNQLDNQIIYRSISFIKNKQRIQGQWVGRGGINFIYGISAILSGLRRVGYNMSQNWIKKSVDFLIKHQQVDGGFGQDPKSYYLKYYSKGVTTVTMTSWGLLGLLQVQDYYPQISINIQKAIRYLIDNFKQYNKFFDRSVIKAKYRGILNIQYPAYAYSFPLMALSRFVKIKENRYHNRVIKFSEDLNTVKKNEQEL